ncbi:MAG: UbiA family prenyltransferase [Candidatus Omnitrophica bacterium]|nr:UbiA family prenyltransferase [Candidatus Omnitrophota bacterium]
MKILRQIYNYFSLVRFSHTIFALPFALMSALAAADGLPEWSVLGWILVCMAGARTAAMTFNRIVDRRLDALNPRTRERHLPAGRVSMMEAALLWLIAAAFFVFGAWKLNFLTFALSPVALLIICGYSYCKRFTSLSHFVLGLSLGIAPVGAWIAVTGSLAAPPVILAAAVMMWVAGFDAIYALMDETFDRQVGLHSLVVALGKQGALRAAFFMHLTSVFMIGVFGASAGMGWIFWVGAIAYLLLILYEHAIVSPDDAKRINIAFFNVNAVISIGLLCFTSLDIFLRH